MSQRERLLFGRRPRLEARTRRHAAVPARHVDAIVNARASGLGDPSRALSRIVALLEAAGARARGTITGSPEELAEALRRAEGRRVLLAGGDGSLHAAANVGAHPLPEIALLPAGRANNLAHALGVPTHWRAAIRLAVRGEARPFDGLAVTTPERSLIAVEGVSAGFHAAARTLYEGENSGDVSAGLGAFARAIRRFAPVPVRLTVDGHVVEDGPVAQVFLSNAPRFAYGFRVAPIAKVDDGLLESIVLRASTRRETLALLGAAHGGRHLDRPGVDWYRGAEARLDVPVPLVADAEPLGVTTAAVTALPGLLRVVRP
ncbi:MAG TPA: diacylglycerol kinase family protein [Solirubrobacteraceae bacterium]|jgi:diacylglycerol kinase family enzyme|nr:diacylglycerol kinase family protein [Solirubrobacteraceae bacterium]